MTFWTLVIAGLFVGLGGFGWWIILFAVAGLATGLIEEVAQKLATVRLTTAAAGGTRVGSNRRRARGRTARFRDYYGRPLDGRQSAGRVWGRDRCGPDCLMSTIGWEAV